MCGCALPTCSTCNPRLQQPNSPGARLYPNANPSCSMVESLGGIVDAARQIATDLGARPYRIFSVVCEWSGGDVGRGVPRIVSEIELLPTPKLNETSGIQGSPRSGGLAERGSVRLTEISPRYTEDQVRGLFHCDAPRRGQEVWIEARVDARDGSTERRRFTVSGVPYRDADRFQWVAVLLRQDQDRTRAGEPYPAR